MMWSPEVGGSATVILWCCPSLPDFTLDRLRSGRIAYIQARSPTLGEREGARLCCET